MKNRYCEGLKALFSKIEATDLRGNTMPIGMAVSKMVDLITERNKKGGNVIFIGNGGSASIASHISTDLMKNGGISSLAFNDSSLLTCVSNDLGYERVFEKPIEVISKRKDILFSISSSGSSENILNATKKARDKGCFIATLSGFDKANPLRMLGDINFYVPSGSYGYVEIVHLGICHWHIDEIMEKKSRNG